MNKLTILLLAGILINKGSSVSFAQTEVTNSSGFVFEKTSLGWKSPSGLIWLETVFPDLTFVDSEKKCKSLGARLPTDVEYEEAEKQGIQEVVKVLSLNEWYWSSVRNLKSPSTVLAFKGGSGYLMNWWEGFLLHAQCVKD